MLIPPKNAVEQIQIAPRECHGHRFIDIRIYFEDDAGAWKHPKEGVTVSVDRREDCKDTVARVEVPLPERHARRRAKAATR